jgi:hypothetical protein
MPAGCILNRQHEQPSAEHLGLGLGGCSPPGRWHPRAEHHRPERRRAHRCRARPLHRDRGGRGVHHPRAAPGQHRCRQVTARRRAARAAVGATLGQARRSPPTEQRFPPVERPPVDTPANARKGQDQSNAEPREPSWSLTATAAQPGRSWPVAGSGHRQRGLPGIPGEEDIMVVEHAHQPGRLDPGRSWGCARESDLLDHDWQGQPQQQAVSRPTDGPVGPTGTPAGRCGPPAPGSCWPSSRSSPADPPWSPMHDGASGAQRHRRQRSPRQPLVGLVRRSPGQLR